VNAKNEEQEPQYSSPFENGPHGWIQWKGTDVCMDCYCECGHHGHIDAEFAYSYQCPKCKQIYTINGHVQFHKVDSVDHQCVVTDESYVEDDEASS